MTDVQALELELVERGETPELLLQIADAYADLNDASTAQLYLDYLTATFPEFADSSEERVVALTLRIEELSNKPPASQPLIAWYQVSTGFDSNASQGTPLSQLDLQLASGEKLVLLVDPDSRAIGSPYVGARIAGQWPVGEDGVVRGVAETIQYAEDSLPTMSVQSVEYALPNHTLALYHFERLASRVGLAYRGGADPLYWGVQIDDRERRTFFGGRGEMTAFDNRSISWSSQLFEAKSYGQLGGSDLRYGLQIRARISFAQIGVQYSVEYARDRGYYDPIFLPEVRDQYLWQRLSLTWNVFESAQRRIDVVAEYNDKEHQVPLNSWQGSDLRLVLSAPF